MKCILLSYCNYILYIEFLYCCFIHVLRHLLCDKTFGTRHKDENDELMMNYNVRKFFFLMTRAMDNNSTSFDFRHVPNESSAPYRRFDIIIWYVILTGVLYRQPHIRLPEPVKFPQVIFNLMWLTVKWLKKFDSLDMWL